MLLKKIILESMKCKLEIIQDKIEEEKENKGIDIKNNVISNNIGIVNLKD